MKQVRFKDFQPQMVTQPGLLKHAEYEPFDAAVDAANQWLAENHVRLINMETVVLPNIWSHHEEGTTDASLGTRGGAPSHWHQFVRCWYLPLDRENRTESPEDDVYYYEGVSDLNEGPNSDQSPGEDVATDEAGDGASEGDGDVNDDERS